MPRATTVEFQLAGMVREFEVGEEWLVVRRRTLHLVVDSLLRPYFPHQHVLSHLSLEDAILEIPYLARTEMMDALSRVA